MTGRNAAVIAHDHPRDLRHQIRGELAADGHAVEKAGLIEASHFDHSIGQLSGPVQHEPIVVAGDTPDAEIEARGRL